MKQIINEQRKYFNTNATKNIDFRIQKLKKLKRILQENENQFYEAIYSDFNKSPFDTYTSELSLLYEEINEAIKKVKRWSKVKRTKTNLINLPAKSYVMPEPLGVTLIIGAWNYPYLLSLAPAVAAIAAGNTVVLKPSELSKNASHIIFKTISENFDATYFSVLEGGIPETSELLKQKFDKIFFTGSVPVGKIIYEAAAKQLTPVTLELGGKSPAFITKNCNLKISIKRLIWSKFLNAGQTCIAPDYVLVHKSIKNNFLKLAKAEIEKSNFSIENNNYVQIINEINTQRLVALLDEKKVYFGGSYNIPARHLEPTIMEDVTFEDNIMQEEIFGPILPVIVYENLDDAILKVNSIPKPLSCYVFTSDKIVRNKILQEVSFGGGAINDAVMHITNNNLPFGGIGDSGIGSYHGEYGFKTFSHYKSIIDKPSWGEPNLKYSPHSLKKLKLIKLLMRQK
ncbi:MAG: aldehyde dehydrogenase family protein [Ignavibacteriae bacterium]|nr:aldehyde dehydrogenase family protein [Ignavibacteriota bacterium]